MSNTFEALKNWIDGNKLNAYAAEHNISTDDPGWVGPMQMIPVLEAMREERMKIEAVASALPDALRAAAAESIRGLSQDITNDSVAAIRGDVVEHLTRAAQVASDAITDAHNTLNASIATQVQNANQAVTALGASTSALNTGAQDFYDKGRAAIRGVKRFYWSHLGIGAAFLIVFVAVTAWTTYTFTLKTLEHRWYDAGFAAGVHHGGHR